MALIRLFALLLILSTVVYVSVSFYARAQRRDKLKYQWRAELRVGDRDAWLREELQKYDHSLRRRLILLVYVVPFVFVGAMVYFQNFM